MDYNVEHLKRLHSLNEIFEELHKTLEWSDNIYVNLHQLNLVVISYFKDIVRFKDFHHSLYSDQHKKAAYTIKWISKLRPVQIRQNKKEISKTEVLANSIFALVAGLTFMEIKVNKLSVKLFENLLYTSQYRAIDGLLYSTTMYVLEKSMQKQTA